MAPHTHARARGRGKQHSLSSRLASHTNQMDLFLDRLARRSPVTSVALTLVINTRRHGPFPAPYRQAWCLTVMLAVLVT
jgi:hypothetical protein